MNERRGQIGSSLIYKLLELASTQGVQFVVSVILARILSPEEFGTISLFTIFITIANVFVQSGFATSLIRKETADDADYSSALYTSLGLALLMYGILALLAPVIADYYETPVLTGLIRITAVILFPGAVVSIQSAWVSRNMRFDRLLAASVIAVAVSGVAAIAAALSGWGVRAMALQQILYYFVLMAALFLLIPWRPKACFEIGRVRQLFGFGWKILVSGLIDTVWSGVYGLVIGKQYSQADLGGYTRAEQFPKLIATNLSAAIQAVMLPAFARVQEDREELRSLLRRTIVYSAFFLFPMMGGLLAVARPLVSLLLTDKWLFCVPYLQILCLVYALWPIHTANLQALNAQGRSDLFLRLEILKKISGLCFLLAGLRFGILGMLWCKLANECVCAYLNVCHNRALLSYGFGQQLRDTAPAALCSFGMALAVRLIGRSGAALGPLPLLLCQIAAGILIYLLLSLALNRKTVTELTALLPRRPGEGGPA